MSADTKDIGCSGSVMFHADSNMRSKRCMRDGAARATWKRRLLRS